MSGYSPPPTAKRSPRYFDATNKRGEIHEWKEELKNSNKEKKKEALKKVIQAMTGGSDVSSLFPDVVNCMQTTSLDLKKLVYLYVINYAKSQPDLAILPIHSFRKDANDQQNPLLRALAVRTMGCIRLEQMTEYLLEPLRKSCKDQDAYVRKTAAICVAKLFDISPAQVRDQGFIEILRDMIGDANPMVVANAVASLCEISNSSRQNFLRLDEDMISKLLHALGECTEWGNVYILDALAMYDPPSSKVAENILEAGIIVRLSSANSAIVLSAVKVMMRYMDRITSPEVVRLLCRKMTPPLVTLLSAEPEIQYVAMRNIILIVQKQPQILQQDVRMFVCKYNDPLYVKLEKIAVMVQLSSERNIDQVLSEFKEYASEVDIECVRKSVRAIGQCAIKLERATERCVDVLLGLVKTKVSYVVQEAIVVIRDIFRKFPGKYEAIILDLCENLSDLDEPDAKSAMIWIIGEYAHRINNSINLFEAFLESFHEDPPTVQQQLLTATVKLCLQCPQTSRSIVAKVLKAATEECNNPDLRDRGYMYWRLLSKSPDMARKVVLSERPTIVDDSFAAQPRILDKLISNISTLSSVYHKTPEMFITGTKEMRIEDDGDEEAENKRETLERVEKEMKERTKTGDRYSENSDNYGDGSASSSSSSGSGDDQRPGRKDDNQQPNAKAPPALRPLSVVMSEQTPGEHGTVGVRVAASIVCGGNSMMGMQLMIGNFTAQPMNQWEVQFKPNSFGLAPASPLQLGEIAPNGNARTTLPIVPNQLTSGSPPSPPLYLEVAIRNSVDVFYFSVGYDLSVVLVDREPMPTEIFGQRWGVIPQDQKLRCVGEWPANFVPSQEQLVHRMRQFHVGCVTVQENPGSQLLYFSAVTINNLTVMCELALAQSSNSLQLVVWADASQLIALWQGFLSELLHIRWQGT